MSLDKAEKIAEQFLEERKKRHEDMEIEVQWTVPEAATEVLLRGRLKYAYVVFGVLFAVVLICPGYPCVFSYFLLCLPLWVPAVITGLVCPGYPCVFSYFQVLCLPLWVPAEITGLVLLWVVKAILVVFLLLVPFPYGIGNMKKPSLLENLPVCWDGIIDIEQKYELEHKQQEKDIKKRRNINEDVKKKVKEEIDKCMKNHKRQFR